MVYEALAAGTVSMVVETVEVSVPGPGLVTSPRFTVIVDPGENDWDPTVSTTLLSVLLDPVMETATALAGEPSTR